MTHIEETTLAHSLEVARRDLLDLSLRNPLLNYKTLRGKGLDISDGRYETLFRALVQEEEHITFSPIDARRVLGNDRDVQLIRPDEQTGARSRHSDLRIQTQYSAAELQGRLLATYRAARTL